MTLGEHFDELRQRLLRAIIGVVVGMGACLFFGEYLFKLMFWPLWLAAEGEPPRLWFNSVPEAFSTYLRVCLVAGAILSSPYGLYQMWQFVAAGLYAGERRTVRRYFLPSVALFLAGVAFFFAVVARLVIRFFLNFARTSFPAPPKWGAGWLSSYVATTAPAAAPAPAGGYVSPLLTLSDYVAFVSTLSLVFGVAFQTPLVVMFLVRSGIVQVQTMRRMRRYVLLLIMIVAAIVTPPDALSMVVLTAPMYVLYELGLLAAGRKRRKGPA